MKIVDLKIGSYFVLKQNNPSSLLLKTKGEKIIRAVKCPCNYISGAMHLGGGWDYLLDHLTPETEVQEVIIEHESDERLYEWAMNTPDNNDQDRKQNFLNRRKSFVGC
jgi:hypothetical protein